MSTRHPTTTSALKAAPYNPRTITDTKLEALRDAMRRFGDLSGIVFNRRTRHTVSGHQRLKTIPPDAPIVVTERFKRATKQGTVAVGHVEVGGERFMYREVNWDLATEQAANVAANQHGGEWDLPQLAALVGNLTDAERPDGGDTFSAAMLGFDERELKQLLRAGAGTRSTAETKDEGAAALGDVQYQIIVSCSDEHAQAQLATELESRGLSCRLLTL